MGALPRMSKHKQTFVQILNPSGSPYTSLKRAHEYVRAGRAIWDGPAIRFTSVWLEQTRAGAGIKPFFASLKSFEAYKLAYRLRTMDEAGYDSIDTMTVPQLQGLPLAGPAIKLIQKGKVHFTPRAPRCKTFAA